MRSVQHRSIGALTYFNKNKQLECGNGVLISNNLILTTAHKIYDKMHGCENTKFKFYVGANGPT
jgi:V8-like Glu-specific endopeptidase